MSSDDMFDSCFTQFELDLSATKSLAIGDAVSRDVSAGAHRWRIRCFPRGYRAEDNGEYVSVSLDLITGGGGGGSKAAVQAIFEAFVTKPGGEPSSSRAQRTLHVYQQPPPPSSTALSIIIPPAARFRWFVKRSDLESLYLADDGVARITCGVIVVVVRDGDGDPLDVPPPDIGTHLGVLLDSADGSDVSFAVDGERFPAHRAVLAARSPVFKGQLLGCCSAKAKATVAVNDMAPATFKAMLRFIYTDDDDACHADAGELECSPPGEMLRRLLAAADRYALDRLKVVCAKKLWQNLSADTVADTLACAEACSCPELKRMCIVFLVDEKNFRDAVLTDGFVQLVQKFPAIIAELKDAVVQIHALASLIAGSLFPTSKNARATCTFNKK